jgi:hypothetical protein
MRVIYFFKHESLLAACYDGTGYLKSNINVANETPGERRA